MFTLSPWYTPYQFAGNKPIEAIDLDGLEEYFIIESIGSGKYKSERKLVMFTLSPKYFLQT